MKSSIIKLSAIVSIFITMLISGCSSQPPEKETSVFNDSDTQKENAKKAQREIPASRGARY